MSSRPDSLILRLHPDDPTLLEVLLREGEHERRVARAQVANPRAWEWTTPPSWLRASAVESALDQVCESFWRYGAPWLGGQRIGLVDLHAIEVPVSTPIGSLATVAKQQLAALTTLGARTGDFVQVV